VFMTSMDRSGPTLTYERRLWADGFQLVAGLDEAGRGAWAGPVVAAAVILPAGEPDLVQHLDGVRDSKALSAARREKLLVVIQRLATAWAACAVPPSEIDTLGIVPATRKAMAQALQRLAAPPDHLLIDYLPLSAVSLPQISLPKGDAKVLSIAAASIVAKVSRDRMMVALEEEIPGYGFAQHKGYGTPQHRAALAELGVCDAHRRSFAPMRFLEANEA
jgi:ribonuclease HII